MSSPEMSAFGTQADRRHACSMRFDLIGERQTQAHKTSGAGLFFHTAMTGHTRDYVREDW